MLKSLIAFLQKLDSWSSKRRKMLSNASNIVYPFYAFCVWMAYAFLLDLNDFWQEAWSGLWHLLLIVFVTSGIGIAAYLTGKRANYLFNITVVPLLIGSLFYFGVQEESLWYDFDWGIMIGTVVYMLSAAYALLGIMQYFWPESKINVAMFRYLAAAFWLIAGLWLTFTVALIIYAGLTEFLEYFFSEYTDWGERILMIALIVTPFMFYVAFSSLAQKYQINRTIVALAFAGLTAFTLGTAFIVQGYAGLMVHQLAKANQILQREGENRKGFTEARNVFFLKSAILHDFRATGDQNNELVAKLYDDSFAGVFEDRLDEDEIPENRTSWGTSAFERKENANVELEFAEYETQVIPELAATETVVTYVFQNSTAMQQEVVLDFDLPSSNSVVTDLKLGLNLELQGQVAPRGAAEQVYQDSLRRRTDPALINKTGLRSHRLRVFPIPSNTDKKTQGRQKVQFTYLSPLTPETSEVIIAPRLNTINLRLQDKTQISAKLLQQGAVLDQRMLAGEQPEFFQQNQIVPYENTLEPKNWCFADETLEVLASSELHAQSNTKKSGVSLFFDISTSAASSPEISRFYQNVQQVFSDQNLRLYTYNFDVYQVATLDDLEFWGYTDSSRVVTHLAANNITDQHVILVTDGHAFERSLSNASLDEIKHIDYDGLSTNTFSIIEFGQEPRAYRDEIVKLQLASGGDIFKGGDSADLAGIKASILSDRSETVVTPDCNELEDEALLAKWQKLQALRLGKGLFAEASGTAKSWEEVAQKQTDLAYEFQIVNFYNSMIALETERQQQDLDRYKNRDDRYNNAYQNYEGRDTQNRNRRQPGMSLGITPDPWDDFLMPPTVINDSDVWSGGGGGGSGLITENDRPENVSASSGVSFSFRDFGFVDAILTVLVIAGLYFFFFRGEAKPEDRKEAEQEQKENKGK